MGGQLSVTFGRGGVDDSVKQGLEHAWVVPHHGDAYGGGAMAILVVDLGDRKLKASSEALDQAADDATLLFEA